jgi:hypothetical protein
MNRMSMRYIAVELLLPFAFIALVFLILFGSMLNSRFDIIDDHEIQRFAATESIHPIWTSAIEYAPPIPRDYIIVEREIELGRFRPFYYITRFMEIDTFGLNPQAWHLYKLMIGVITVTLFYMAARLVKIPPFFSAMMAGLLILQTSATEIWYKLGPAETMGMLLTAIAMFSLVYSARKPRFSLADMIALVALALAGWTKESFILVSPALIWMRLMLTIWWHPQFAPLRLFLRLIPLWGIGAIVFIGQLGFVFFVIRTDYARMGSDSFNPLNWVVLFGSLSPQQLIFIPAMVGIILTAITWYRRKKRPQRLWLAWAFPIFLILWIVPQFILYTNGFGGSRYVYPVVVGVIVMNIIPLVTAYRYFPRLSLVLVIPFMIVLGYGLILDTHNLVTRFASATIARGEAIDYITATIEPDEYVLIETHPTKKYEHSLGFVILMGTAGMKSPIAFYFFDRDYDENPSNLDFNNLFPDGYQMIDEINPEQVSFMVSLFDEERLIQTPPNGMNLNEFTRREFTQDYTAWNLIWLPPITTSARFVIYQKRRKTPRFSDGDIRRW